MSVQLVTGCLIGLEGMSLGCQKLAGKSGIPPGNGLHGKRVVLCR
jgi:hypothetical protein